MQLTMEEKAILSNNQCWSLDTPHSSTDLRTRVVCGGIWVFALRITDRLFKLARTIILARVLAPADFGVFGIALLAMSALETFSQTGFNAALIQKKEDTKPYLDTAWTVQAIRGVLLALILFTIAGHAAAFFDAPAAKRILQVIALSVLLRGFTNIGVVYFQKELEFRKQFLYQLSGTFADMTVAISMALLLRSVWALALGLLAGALVRMVLSYFIHPYRPQLGFNQQQFKELFGFGRWVLGSSILVFLITQGDDIFVGKLLGVTALGFYQLAYRLSNMPATEITHVISQVTFPAYSKLQDDIPRLREAYLKVLKLTAFLSFPIAGLIFVLAGDFTKIFLGQKWMPMVPAMQLLVLWGLIRSIGATTGPIFASIGKPGIATKLQFLQLVLLVVLIYPLAMTWGIVGTSLAVVFAALVANLAAIYMVLKVAKCTACNFSKIISVPLMSTAVVVISIFIAKLYCVNLYQRSGFFLFTIISVVSILAYLGITCLSYRFFACKIRSIVKETILLSREIR
jgi:lipopolysaccharide exporter